MSTWAKENKKYVYIIKKSFCHLQIFTTFIVPVFRKNLFKLFCTLIPFIPCKVYLAEFQIKKTMFCLQKDIDNFF